MLLALLNGAAIPAIAYDDAHAASSPVTWDMRAVLTVATTLGLAGLVASFGPQVLAERVFDVAADQVQTLMYLKLSVAGDLTIFLIRTRGPLWSSRPLNPLLGTVLLSQALAPAIAVSDLLIPAIPWTWALAEWPHALGWFVVNDRVKLLAYGVLDRRTAGAARRAGAPEPAPST